MLAAHRQAAVVSPSSPGRPTIVQAQSPGVVASPVPAAVPAAVPMPQTSPALPVGSTAANRNTATANKIMELLKDREGLKTTVMRLFKSLSGGSVTLDVQGLARFKVVLVQVLGIPGQVFGDDLMTDYVRFDFDGNGRLEVNEVYKLVKFNLWEHVKALGGTPTQVNVPFKTLEQAGYRTSRDMGEGSQAVVKLCTDQQGQERCIKCYQKGKMSVGGLEELKDEFEAMRLLGCQSLAQTVEVFQDQSFYYMVNEVYYGGDFGTLKQRAIAQGVQPTEEWWRRIFRQCLRALEFMHQQAMVHCDIKEPNIMLKTDDYRNPDVVVVDFGLSKAMGAGETGICGGTPGYIPPETLKTRKWYPGGDVFSLGVVIFQMMTDSTPDAKVRTKVHMKGLFLEGCSTFQEMCQATMVRQPPFQRMPPELSGLTDLTSQLLQKELQKRARAPQALQHPWIQEDGNRSSARRSSPLVSSHPLATQGITPQLLESFHAQSGRSQRPAARPAGPKVVEATSVASAASTTGAGVSAQASLPPSAGASVQAPSQQVVHQPSPLPVMQQELRTSAPHTPSPPMDATARGSRITAVQVPATVQASAAMLHVNGHLVAPRESARVPAVSVGSQKREVSPVVTSSRGVGGLSVDRSMKALDRSVKALQPGGIVDTGSARQPGLLSVGGQHAGQPLLQSGVGSPAQTSSPLRSQRASLVMPAQAVQTSVQTSMQPSTQPNRQLSGASNTRQAAVMVQAAAYPAPGMRPLDQVRVRQLPVRR